MKLQLACAVSLALCGGVAAIPRAEAPLADSVGPGVGVLTGAQSSNCAPLILHNDGSYENGVSWKSQGEFPPFWGAFAERFEGPLDVCGLVYDLTQVDDYTLRLGDVFIWNDHLGQPGSVRYVAHDVDFGTVATWPSISRHIVPVAGDHYQTGNFWVGIWGNWPLTVNAWFVATDEDGPTGTTPLTHIRAGIGYEPAGWQPVSNVWENTHGVGIGILAQPLNPSGVPDAPIVVGSWGKVKSLYQ